MNTPHSQAVIISNYNPCIFNFVTSLPLCFPISVVALLRKSQLDQFLVVNSHVCRLSFTVGKNYSGLPWKSWGSDYTESCKMHDLMRMYHKRFFQFRAVYCVCCTFRVCGCKAT